ncbi:TetR family transcriptional regulator C-terminal domain-containing protein [Streptomyces sp. RFCAC02]|uniref:TetR/AcrR family transcriptional regulator n=1 Tax=Streptomyces sp. RFCAC02 TaxID=2499143 RepID=UPI0010224972|nr:TetR family transcriptional regulator C-terminal domain-containing protein [Streptomyces sp. RFCAC02]
MTSPRARLIADTAITVLAARGPRGLTHRAVDKAAGLPAGSTSNHARTRAALLRATLERLAEAEAAEYPPPVGDTPRERLTGAVAHVLHTALTEGRALTLARLELATEAAHRPELRERYDALGHGFLDMAARLLAAAGCEDPWRRARWLVAWCDGVLFHATVGSGASAPPSADDLRDQVDAMVDALLPPASAE